MIPPDDPRTGTTRQVARYASSTDTSRRSGDGHRPEVEHVAELWALEGYLRGLQEHYRADRRLYGRVRDVAVRLQALAQEVQASAGPQPAGSRSPASTGRDAVRADLEAAFERWLADPVEADEVRLADRDRSPQPLEQILGVLAASTRALSDEAAASLG